MFGWDDPGFYLNPQPAMLERFRVSTEFIRRFIVAFHRAGGRLLVGSDTPMPMLVPGYAFQDELQAHVSAGLAPAVVLRLATRGAAEFLHREAEFGSVAPGLSADLLLLEGDPRASLGVLTRPVGVMTRGTWYTRDALARSVEEVRAAHAARGSQVVVR